MKPAFLTLQAVLLVCALPSFDVSVGKTHYERLQREGSCWDTVVQALETQCSELGEEARARLALALANCHLRRSGLKEVECAERRFEECTREMDWKGWTAYTEFFTHVYDICAYLTAQIWQQRTSETVDSLAKGAQDALLALNQTLAAADSIQSDQQRLRTDIEGSRNEVNAMASQLLALSSTLTDWLSTIHSSLKDVVRLQELLFGELLDVKSMLYFLTHACGVFLATSITETARSRSRLLLLLGGLVVAERWVLRPEQRIGSTVSSLRLSVVLVSLAMVLRSYRDYKDVGELNHELLMQLLHRLSARTKELLTSHRPKPLPRRTFYPLSRIREALPELETSPRRQLRF